MEFTAYPSETDPSTLFSSSSVQHDLPVSSDSGQNWSVDASDATTVPTQLSPGEQRVLGCLIEKERTTPDDYPLTLNALMRAANQSTNRDPVMNLSSTEVERCTESLKSLGLLRFVHMASGRATTKYRHVAGERLGLDGQATALLGLLLLRGMQTPGELKTRSERLTEFTSLDAVSAVLRVMADQVVPLVEMLPRQPGQKESRWVHRLGGEVPQPPLGDARRSWQLSASESTGFTTQAPSRELPESGTGQLRDEVQALRTEVAQLRATVSQLCADLGLEAGLSSEAGLRPV